MISMRSCAKMRCLRIGGRLWNECNHLMERNQQGSPLNSDDLKDARRKAALDYHEFPTPGKLSVTATKQLLNQSDLALAYSPGGAAACDALVENPLNAFRFTARGNLVGVISNG